MPVILPPLPDPFDLVIQGEQMRQSVMDAPVAMTGSVRALGGGGVTGFASLVQDEDLYLPMNRFTEGNILSIRRVRNGDLQRRVNAGIATPCGAWIPNDWTALLQPLLWATDRWGISGVTRDSANAPLGNCWVIVQNSGYLTPDTVEAELQGVWSDGGGNYSVEVPLNTSYQLTGYKEGAPDVAGITRRDVKPGQIG